MKKLAEVITATLGTLVGLVTLFGLSLEEWNRGEILKTLLIVAAAIIISMVVAVDHSDKVSASETGKAEDTTND